MLVSPTTLETEDDRQLDLTVGRIYEVLGIEADDYRLLSDEKAQEGLTRPSLYLN